MGAGAYSQDSVNEQARSNGSATLEKQGEPNLTEDRMIQRSNITYGQLDKVLRSFGFSRRVFESHGKGIRYEHKESGALITLPLFPEEDHVLQHHMIVVRGTLDNFGLAEPSVFEAKVQRAG